GPLPARGAHRGLVRRRAGGRPPRPAAPRAPQLRGRGGGARRRRAPRRAARATARAGGGPRVRGAALLLIAVLVAAPARADEPAAEQDLAARSLPLRTALHQDPSLEQPLQRLLAMYREAQRVDELLGMYRAHLRAYPRDPRGKTVLIRL